MDKDPQVEPDRAANGDDAPPSPAPVPPATDEDPKKNALKKIKALMTTAVSTNEESKAHRANIIFLINYGLEAK